MSGQDTTTQEPSRESQLIAVAQKDGFRAVLEFAAEKGWKLDPEETMDLAGIAGAARALRNLQNSETATQIPK